jgi:hypothetical protein
MLKDTPVSSRIQPPVLTAIKEKAKKDAAELKRIQDETNAAKDNLAIELQTIKLKIADDTKKSEESLKIKQQELNDLQIQIDARKKELEELKKGK